MHYVCIPLNLTVLNTPRLACILATMTLIRDPVLQCTYSLVLGLARLFEH